MARVRDASSITDNDYMTIVSTYTSLTTPLYNCIHCKKMYPGQEERQRKHRERLGCGGNSQQVYLPTYDMEPFPKIKYERCLGNFLDKNAIDLINYNTRWQNGDYPFNGGYLEQPAKFVEAMELVDNLKAQKSSEIEAIQKKHGK